MQLHGCVQVTVIHQLAKFYGHRPYQKGSVTLLHLSQHPLRHCQANLWLHGRASLTISHQSAMFSGQRSCGRGNTHHELPTFPVWWTETCIRGDILFLFCHVSIWSECHVTLWIFSPHHKSSSCQVWWSQA